MAGLVGYASSDEDSVDEKSIREEEEDPKDTAVPSTTTDKVSAHGVTDTSTSTTHDGASTQQQPSEKQPQDEAPQVGPIRQSDVPLGPSLPPMDAPMSFPGDVNDNGAAADDENQQTPSSPYSANRAALQNLTLPSIPNLDIPPSPPGSPPAGANKKFEQFLELKKKGTHFNSKLEQSTALRNPALMDKLMAFVGADDIVDQYQTTLPPDLWDPRAFPPSAFRHRLRKSREGIAKEKELERANGTRTTVEFVPSAHASEGGGATR